MDCAFRFDLNNAKMSWPYSLRHHTESIDSRCADLEVFKSLARANWERASLLQRIDQNSTEALKHRWLSSTGSSESVSIAISPERRAINDADVFRNRNSVAKETLPSDQVGYWAGRYEADRQVVRDAYAEILRGMQNSPAAARECSRDRVGAVSRDTPMNSVLAELRSLPRWVLWRFETRNDKRSKVLYSVTGPSTTNPTTWSSFADACAATDRVRADGIGFVFWGEDNIIGVDLDHRFPSSARGSRLFRAEGTAVS